MNYHLSRNLESTEKPTLFVIARVVPQVVPQFAGWQSIFTTRLLRRPAACGTPRPAKAGTFWQH